MGKRMQAMWGVLAVALWAAPVHSASGQPPEQRELIYCADQMTHEEREAYRVRMRAARTPEEKAALRQSHQRDMQSRASGRGLDASACEPPRLRLRQGRAQ